MFFLFWMCAVLFGPASLAGNLDWLHFEIIAARYPNIFPTPAFRYRGEMDLSVSPMTDLNWANLKTESLTEFGDFGRTLTASLILPDPLTPLDNPQSEIQVIGETGRTLFGWVKNHATASLTVDGITFYADQYTLCSNNGVCEILLSDAPVEEFSSTERLKQFTLKAIRPVDAQTEP